MNIDKLKETRDAAWEFINAAQVVINEYEQNNRKSIRVYGMNAASAKRKSMDLTRSLAQLRKGE